MHNDHAGGDQARARGARRAGLDRRRRRAVLRSGTAPVPPGNRVASRSGRFAGSPPVEPDRELREGDELGHGFVVLDTPGHSPGHVSFWREADRTLICGDVFFNMNILTTAVGPAPAAGDLHLRLPQNRASERRLAELDPAVACFGHGPPLRDPAAIRAFVATLPAD